MYNAIICDGMKNKTIMTKMVFDSFQYPNTMITWNLSYDEWFMKEEFSRNQKLKRFKAPPVSPLVIGLLTKSKEIVRTLLAAKVDPDAIDFGDDRGKLILTRNIYSQNIYSL